MPDRISFTRPSVARIANVVRAVENARPASAPLRSKTVEAGAKAKPRVFRVCTFTGAWAINAAKVVRFRNVTSTPNTVAAVNIFAAVGSGTATRNCAIAKDGTAWYLIAAECG
jgi:streptogramin lyase